MPWKFVKCYRALKANGQLPSIFTLDYTDLKVAIRWVVYFRSLRCSGPADGARRFRIKDDQLPHY
jgi:hypothetical protein